MDAPVDIDSLEASFNRIRQQGCDVCELIALAGLVIRALLDVQNVILVHQRDVLGKVVRLRCLHLALRDQILQWA